MAYQSRDVLWKRSEGVISALYLQSLVSIQTRANGKVRGSSKGAHLEAMNKYEEQCLPHPRQATPKEAASLSLRSQVAVSFLAPRPGISTEVK